MNISRLLIASGLMLTTAAFASDYHYGKGKYKSHTFEVTVTNISSGQVFTPLLVASHTRQINFFELGAEPSDELADLAEGGATDGLQMQLDSLPRYVMDTNTSGITANGDPLIDPGESVTVVIHGSRKFNRISLAGMLLPTNDTFVAIDSMPLTRYSSSRTALAYDAGSEMNDELCMNIPGPQCGGSPFSEGLAEGFVHISRGISGEGDLNASDYDWRNPVAHVTVRLVD